MKYKKTLIRYEKKKSINYSTTVTLTKKENILVITMFLLVLIMGLISGIEIKNNILTFIVIMGGIILLAIISLLIIFRKSHKEERIANETIIKK